jgi:hypothetical protein
MAVAFTAIRWRFPAVFKPFATFVAVWSFALLGWLNFAASRPISEGMILSGVIAAVVAVADWDIIRRRERGLAPPPAEASHCPGENDSVTFDLEDVGSADIVGTQSTADKMIRAKGVKGLSADDNVHDPKSRRA